MRKHIHVTLTALFLAVIAPHDANGLPVPLAARSTSLQRVPVNPLMESKPAAHASLDTRGWQIGGSGVGDLFDVVAQVLTKPHDASPAPIHSDSPSPQPGGTGGDLFDVIGHVLSEPHQALSAPIPSESPVHHADMHQPIATPVQPSGQLRRLKKPSWMKPRTKFGLTPDRLEVLRSGNPHRTEKLIKALHRTVMVARNHLEAAGDPEKIAAWREKHDSDFAIRKAAYDRLSGDDADLAEHKAEATLNALQSSARLVEADEGSSSSRAALPFLASGRLGRRTPKGIRARSQIVTYHSANKDKRRWYLRESDIKLSKSPAASAQDARDVISSDSATRKFARSRIKNAEADLLRPEKASGGTTSAAHEAPRSPPEQNGAHDGEFDGPIHIPFDWEY